MKKMLLVNGSPRKNGASAELLSMITEKAKAAGYDCETVNLGDLKISHCKACMSCKKTKECAIKDDMTPLYKKFQDADAFAMAVPIYFGRETGLLANFVDRLYALMDRKADGSYDVRFGNKKKGIVAIPCGAPDGNMTYLCASTHLVVVMRMFGMTEVAAGIIPGAPMGPIKDSKFTKELMSSVDFLKL